LITNYTTFDYACVNNATFVDTSFNSGFFGRGTTSFVGAKGHDVDFSNAVNLPAVRLGAGVTNPRFEGTATRPKAAKPPSPGEGAICR
jgi:hypothetical protein